MKCFNNPAVECLMARGNISRLDATILIMFCFCKEITQALETATVWQLRDQTLMTLRNTLNTRYPVEEVVEESEASIHRWTRCS